MVVFYAYCFVRPIVKTLVNDAGRTGGEVTDISGYMYEENNR